MLKKLIPAAIAATTLFLPVIAQAQTTYNGNGATGFGGTLGNGSLTVSSTATSGGSVTFTFNPSGGFGGNDVVVYIDSTTGGFANTSTFKDNGDNGRRAISGYSGNTPNPQTVVNFASGFGADYAISFENNNFNGLFSLASGGTGGAFTYVSGVTPTSGGPYTITIPESSIGITPGASIKFVASLIDAGSAYRSNETVGASTTTTDPGNAGSAPNAGFGGTTTFSNSNSFTTAAAAPEPSEYATLLIGAGVLGGTLLVRRRRTA